MNDLGSFFGGGFNTDSVPPQDDFDVLPPGKYPVMIEKAEIKQTKTKTGYYISLTFTVLDGPAKNRKLWDNINIANPSDKCVEIGLRQLAALGKAVGLQAITDTSELLNRYCLAHVKVKDNDNNIRTYSAFDDVQSVKPPVQGPLMSQQQLPAYSPPIQQQSVMSGQQSQYCPQMPLQQPYQQPQPQVSQAAGAPAGKPPWAR